MTVTASDRCCSLGGRPWMLVDILADCLQRAGSPGGTYSGSGSLGRYLLELPQITRRLKFGCQPRFLFRRTGQPGRDALPMTPVPRGIDWRVRLLRAATYASSDQAAWDAKISPSDLFSGPPSGAVDDGGVVSLRGIGSGMISILLFAESTTRTRCLTARVGSTGVGG